MENEIRYFSMFTGVGGFELGLERAKQQDTENRNFGQKSWKQLQHIQHRWDFTNNSKLWRWSHGKECLPFYSCFGFKNTRSQSSLQRGWNENPRSSQNIQTDGDKSSNEARLFNCVGMSEWDKYSNQVLRYQFPTIKNWGDCTKIKPEELPDFDMLCGGSPCQDFSIAGKRKGLFKEDGTHTRSGLFYQFLRIASVKKPKYMLMENVKGMLSSKNKETGEYNFDSMMEAVCDLGYAIDFTELNSKFFGVPQNRQRIYILAIRNDCIDKEKII